MVRYWVLLLAAPLLVFAIVSTWVRTSPRARYLWDYAKLHLPVTGPILQKIILARFANFFAMMYQSGITVLDAIRTSEGIVGNRVIYTDDVRMGEFAGERCFRQKQFSIALAMFLVAQCFSEYNLDGDVAIDKGIQRLIDATGRAFAQFANNLVFADFFYHCCCRNK